MLRSWPPRPATSPCSRRSRASASAPRTAAPGCARWPSARPRSRTRCRSGPRYTDERARMSANSEMEARADVGDDETRWEKIAANLRTIGGAVLLALLIRTCFFEAFEIEGPSMEPSLLNGDRVVVAKFLY